VKLWNLINDKSITVNKDRGINSLYKTAMKSGALEGVVFPAQYVAPIIMSSLLKLEVDANTNHNLSYSSGS